MSRFATLDSMKKKADEDKESNEYYAGGVGSQGGGSGLSVIGGDGRRPTGGADVNKIFSRAQEDAKEHGGNVGDQRLVSVTFYENGFVVGEDGPLRQPGIPENDQFLNDISQGYCPKELVQDGQPAALQIHDKRTEQYKPPPEPAYVAFSGNGQAAGAAVSSDDSSVITPGSSKAPTVDESEPTIRVQLTFVSNRKRMVVKFNKSHTVRDLIATIDASGNVNGQYQMLSSVRGPPKPIQASEFDKSLTDAGVAGASVSVKQL
mmetsp:Transcript_17671/g.28596  ORF Transcript_17671/g.28596 Transcript_17671/m.28596 type:complete len:262 (+) Transcript_17671:54-839(+)